MESMLYIFNMMKNMLPEAVQTPPRAAMKLNSWAVVAVIVSLVSRWLLKQDLDRNMALQILIALAPIVPGLFWARSISRWMRQLDELQRQIQHEAWLFAASGTVFLVTALNLVNSAGIPKAGRFSHGLGWEGTFAAMFLLYCVGCTISNRRYK